MRGIIKTLIAGALLIVAVMVSVSSATAQFAESAKPQQANGQYQPAMPVPGVSAVGLPTYVQVQKSAGFITIGRAFGDFLEPYIDAAVQALIAALISWLCWELKKRTGIEIDKGHRDAIAKALSNQASSLVADGMVKVEGTKIDVHSDALAKAAQEVMAVVPDAAKHFGITPEYVQARIIDTIPQIAAGAQMIAKQVETQKTGGTLP